MKQVTMYECQHCKKLFKTPKRHVCKRNPIFTNCYSCRSWLGQFYFEKHSWDMESYTSCEPEDACIMYKTSAVDSAYDIMKDNGWSLECPDYKQRK